MGVFLDITFLDFSGDKRGKSDKSGAFDSFSEDGLGSTQHGLPLKVPSTMKRISFFATISALLAASAAIGKTGGKKVPAGPVTFNEHIAPIVHKNCTVCHREGQAGPFKLITYREVSKRARLILDVAEERYMPPWKPVPGHNEFANERTLSDGEIALIRKWIDDGRPEGDPSKAPKPPAFEEGWMLGKPDLVVKMDKAFTVPADGPDIYRNFAIPLKLKEDKWVKAIEYRPSARAVVHHSLFFLDDSGEAVKLDGQDGRPGFNQMKFSRAGGLGGYIPGTEPLFWPGELALPLKRGSDLVLASHFHPSGKVEKEQATVGIYFAEKPSPKKILPIQVPPAFGRTMGIDIPAGEKEYRVEDTFVLPAPVEAIVVGGHAHYVCKEMKMTANLPGGEVKTLLYIDDWDLNWQGNYQYKDPVSLPEGTIIRTELVYDNSAGNPRNPFNPPRRIIWGRESTDEMGSMTLQVIAKDEKDVPKLERSYRQFAGRKAVARLGRELLNGDLAERAQINKERMLEGIIVRLDRNKDKKLQKLEVPVRYQKGWDKADADKDGALTAKEIETIWPEVRKQMIIDQMRQRQQQRSQEKEKAGEGRTS